MNRIIGEAWTRFGYLQVLVVQVKDTRSSRLNALLLARGVTDQVYLINVYNIERVKGASADPTDQPSLFGGADDVIVDSDDIACGTMGCGGL